MEMQTIQFRREQDRAAFAAKPLIFQPASRGVSDFRGSFEEPLLILLAIVGILLLISCATWLICSWRVPFPGSVRSQSGWRSARAAGR